MVPAPKAPSSALLAAFLATNPGALRVSGVLKVGAEVALRFADEPGDWRLYAAAPGEIRLEPVVASDPDFELHMPPAALQDIVSGSEADVGELGIAFFEHIVAKDPARHISLKVHSGIVKLTRRGWLSALTLGGPKVVKWMAGKGLRGGGAVASVLGRFRD